MASIPSNGYREVMVGTNNYTGSNSYDADCPKTAIVPVDGDDLCNKTYVDGAGGGIIGLLTDKGSLITADGTQAVIFDQNPYQTALSTTTAYDWTSLALGQSRTFTTTVPTLLPLGATITITYSGTDNIKGTVTAVVGTTVTITITALNSNPYTPAVFLQTAAPITYATGVYLNPLPYITADTTPIPPEIPANFMITQGSIFFYQPSGVATITITLGGTSLQRAVSTAGVMPISPAFAPPPPAIPTAVFWNGANGGCFVGAQQVLTINTALSNTSSPSWGFLPSAPDFASYFAGSLTGYQLSYSTGAITIDDDIALVADPASATGLSWGVINTGSIGAVNSVVGGTNILMSGTLSTPVVNLRNPLTAELNMGSQSLRDSASAVGTSGQVLTAGTGGQVLWGANGVSSITAGNNIDITGTASVPIVGLKSPLTSTLALGTTSITGSTSNITLSSGTNQANMNGNLGFTSVVQATPTTKANLFNTSISVETSTNKVIIQPTSILKSVGTTALTVGTVGSAPLTLIGNGGNTDGIQITQIANAPTTLTTSLSNVKYYPDCYISNGNASTVAVPLPQVDYQRLTLNNLGLTNTNSWNN